ncbi:MAG: CvpA family protein [Solobacterium sp.]|nr:CvpA family protein [Solobacterium sp.]
MAANILVLAVLLVNIYAGYRTGVLRRIVALLGTVVSFYGSWFLGTLFSEYIRIVPRSWVQGIDFKYSSVLSRYINETAWLILLFVVFRFIFFLIDIGIKGIQKNSKTVHVISSALGAIVGVVETVALVLVACVIIDSPFIVGGTKVVNDSFLGSIKDIAEEQIAAYITPVLDADAFGQLYNNASALTQEQRQNLAEWMESRGYEDISFFD